MRVLLIEDDDSTARALRVLFHQWAGVDVLWASTLADGRTMLDEDPDCVVLDLMLPDGDGVEILEEVRDRGGDRPRVVIVTAQVPSSISVAQAVGLRPDALIHKPYEIDVLMAAVKGEPAPDRLGHRSPSHPTLSPAAP